MLVESVETFDPFSPQFLIEPGGAMQKLLDDAPAFYHEPTNTYYILRYEDARAALGDSDTYSNVKSKTIPIPPHLRGRIPERYELVGQLVQSLVPNLDPPDHTPQRKAAQRTFSHKRIRGFLQDFEQIANEAIDALDGRRSFDLYNDFAIKVTLRVITTLLDVPDYMVPGLYAWIDDVFKIQAPIEMSADEVQIDDEELVARYERLYEGYRTYSALIEERLADPGEDLASAMLTVIGPDGKRLLSNDQVLGYMLALTAAGTDTTANLIVNMVRYFTQSPDQLELVLENPGLWDNAVNEGLRRAAIACQKYRISKVPSVVQGLEIPARARVSVSVAAANHDPRKFPDPVRFDVTRANASEHVALGRGRHYCLGAPVVMPEARIALSVLYERLPDIRADLNQELAFMPIREARSVVSQRAARGNETGVGASVPVGA